ncbi:alpha/beta fold hydrolase [Planctomycetota bacterium]
MKQLPDYLQEEYPFKHNYLQVSSGFRMHYLDEGPDGGAALLMVHGNPTWSFYYRNLVKAFGEEYRVIVPDHIGCGLSDKPQQDYGYSLAERIDDLDQLLRHLELKEIILVVHDWGGPIGIGAGLRHQEIIKGLVIFNTAAFLSKRIPWRINICRIPVFGEISILGLNAFARAATCMATTRAGGLPVHIASGFTWPYDNWQNRIAILKFVHDIPLKPAHKSYAVVKEIQDKLVLFKNTPKMILWGERDFCFTLEFLEKWLEYYPDAQVHRFPDAGHYVVEDALDDILVELGEFVNRIFPKTAENSSVKNGSSSSSRK